MIASTKWRPSPERRWPPRSCSGRSPRRGTGGSWRWSPLSRGRLVEGYIDLAFETDDGRLVVVDYKTDAVVDPGRYRLQIGAYAAALARATGREVSEGWLVFAGVDGAEEREVGDLSAVVAEVEAVVAG